MSSAIGNEIKIGRVLFVDINKIPAIRKRLGFPSAFSKIVSSQYSKVFFEQAKTFAFVTFKGIPDEKETECRELIENAVNIISFSQLGYCNRKNNSQFGLIKDIRTTSAHIINTELHEFTVDVSVESKVLLFYLSKEWKHFHKNYFYLNFLKFISNPPIKMQRLWKDTIIRAAIMIGKSMQSRDLEYCFLWNMIVIEMLLTGPGDKYSDSLPERAQAFLGWIGFWDENNYNDKIKELYKKRCQFVHDGNSKNITVADVVFTDDLVFNLFWNIIQHISLFPTKKSVVDFSEKIKAEKLLEIKSKVLPRTFHFMKKDNSEINYKRI